MRRLAITLVLGLLIVNSQPISAAPATLTKREIENGPFPLPRLSQGYDMITFSDGHFKDKETEADINQIAVGSLDNAPAAVGLVIWNTGGTGDWEVLGLYRLVAGKPQCVGWFDLEDRARVNSVRVANNCVILDWMKHGANDPATFPTVHEVKKLSAHQFEPVQQAEDN
jgi:hypothetical protein